jgi:hypothetical protein
MIMTQRNGLSDLSARRECRSVGGHRTDRATRCERSEILPFRSLLERFAGRQQTLPMPRIAGRMSRSMLKS